MPFPSNLHTHTLLDDGKNSFEEFVRAAIDKGFESIGFSCHSYFKFDTGQCMQPENLDEYHGQIAKLKQKYAGIIEIYTGRELDFMSDPDDGYSYDYTIGAVHNVYLGGEYFCIDESEQAYKRALKTAGSPENLVAEYYGNLIKAAKRNPDILAHFDIIIMEGRKFFDTNAEWYKKLAIAAADEILKRDIIIEINTGGLFREYHDNLYPAPWLLDYMLERGVKLTLSADAHSIRGLDYYFDEVIGVLKSKGVKALKMLKGGRFEDYCI